MNASIQSDRGSLLFVILKKQGGRLSLLVMSQNIHAQNPTIANGINTKSHITNLIVPRCTSESWWALDPD